MSLKIVFVLTALLSDLAILTHAQITAPVYISNWTFSQLVPHAYEKSQPPVRTNASGLMESVNIEITLQVTQLMKVNSGEQSYTVDFVYIQRWRDHRLNLPPQGAGVRTVPLSPKVMKNLWIPDVFLANSIDPVMPIMKPAFMEIDMETMELVSTTRQVAKLGCPMDLFYFPLDEQICAIELALMRNPRDRAVIRFHKTSSSHIEFPNYYILLAKNQQEEECVSMRGPMYSCISAKLELFRKFSYYLIRIYSPSFLVVVTSFVGFWIPPQGYSARTGLIVTPLLALVTQQTMISSEINVSYIVSIHIWMMVNTMFVFLSLTEFAAAIVYSHVVEDRKDEEKVVSFQTSSSFLSSWFNILLRTVYGSKVPFQKNPMDRNKVDYVARILFPTAYFSFVILYFIALCGPCIVHKSRHDVGPEWQASTPLHNFSMSNNNTS